MLEKLTEHKRVVLIVLASLLAVVIILIAVFLAMDSKRSEKPPVKGGKGDLKVMEDDGSFIEEIDASGDWDDTEEKKDTSAEQVLAGDANAAGINANSGNGSGTGTNANSGNGSSTGTTTDSGNAGSTDNPGSDDTPGDNSGMSTEKTPEDNKSWGVPY